MISRISCDQSKCSAARPCPCFDTMPLISLLVCAVLYVITFTPSFISSPECAHLSPSVCAVLYVITFTPSFISSPECAHLSPSTYQLLLMFLHLILCCPSSYCRRHAIIKCRITILINYFPCLVARFLPREDSLAPLFAYLRI